MSFTRAVRHSVNMPTERANHDSEDKYHKQCIAYINKAQKIYDEIQQTEPTQALIDKLELTVAAVSA